MKFKKNKGFTLLELIVVIAVISILAVILLPRFVRITKPANDARRLADIRTIQGYLELYYQQNRSYPVKTANGAGAFGSGNNCGTGTVCYDLILAGVATSIPADPVELGNYYYRYESIDGQSYVIGAQLEAPNPSALKDDVDGTQGSIDCDGGSPETVYCVQF